MIAAGIGPSRRWRACGKPAARPRHRSTGGRSDRTRPVTANQEQELLAVARDAADAAAVELRMRFGEEARGVRSKSSPTDLVSEADLAAETVIRALLGERRPDDAILGEEGGETGDGELRWVVDPLDGTANYLFGIPAFAVSIACEDSSGVLAGVVLDPIREERFEATRSGQSTLNGELIQPGRRAETLDVALVATGFGYKRAVRARQAEVLTRVLPRVRDIRRVGAAALDLCWCACGRFDAYYERGLNPWDVAAGGLIASRAGLSVRDLPSSADDPAGTAAAPEWLIDEFMALIAPA
jgi:myo-inositol-1(or 4)-monophosphatase